MNKRLMTGIALITLTLCGCSTMNSDFSCNAMASDSCLTIEQVDAMTRFADDGVSSQAKKYPMKAEQTLQLNQGAVIPIDKGQSVWVAHKARSQKWA